MQNFSNSWTLIYCVITRDGKSHTGYLVNFVRSFSRCRTINCQDSIPIVTRLPNFGTCLEGTFNKEIDLERSSLHFHGLLVYGSGKLTERVTAKGVI